MNRNQAKQSSTAPKQAAAHTPLDLAQFDGHTPGPWIASQMGTAMYIENNGGYVITSISGMYANLIAAAPALLSECRSQREEIKALREVLEKLVQFAGSDWAYKYPPDQWDAYPPDCIIEARAALKVSP